MDVLGFMRDGQGLRYVHSVGVVTTGQQQLD